MKTTIIKASLATMLLLGASGAAIAHPYGDGDKAASKDAAADTPTASAGHGKIEFIAKYDIDGDGKVSKAEFEQRRKTGYDARDADGNGTLTEAEYVNEYAARLDAEIAEMRQRQMRQAYVRFEVLDSDKDEAMTLDEFHASGSRMFARLDTDGDGIIDDADTAGNF